MDHRWGFLLALTGLIGGQALAHEDPCLAGDRFVLRGPLTVDHLEIRSSGESRVWRVLGLVDSPTASGGLRAALLEHFPDEHARSSARNMRQSKKLGRYSTSGKTANALGRQGVDAIVPSGQQADKYGRTGVILTSREPSSSIQAMMVKSGLAKVHHEGLDEACFNHLIGLEDEAIRRQKGVWADPGSSVLRTDRPQMMAPRIHSYQVMEGRILSTGRTARIFYLNFGRYWAEDFTVEIRRRAEASLKQAGKSPEDWVGRRVRVRGWLSESRGPMIALDSPRQIELISD